MEKMVERNYEFRKRLLEVHKPNRRDYNVVPLQNEIIIDDTWDIVIPENADRVVLNAAKDLCDYFFISMGVFVRLIKTNVNNIKKETEHGVNKIILATKEIMKNLSENLDTPRSYRFICSEDKVVICGYDERGTAQGCYYLEDLMNLKSAPVIKKNDVCRKPLFSPRMVHSGYGLDMFPNEHLSAIAHAGMDSILVFTKDVDTTPNGYLDFNELIYRAAGYGIDVYAYSYLKSTKHPGDVDAKSYYESTYGRVFEKCPGLKGVVLVGESVEFPSKDPHTSGKLRLEGNHGGKPSPGWWPCYDYPQWLNLVKKVIRQHNPEADIVFWTYNWGYVDKEHRLELIKNLPTDISLQVTFEMFEKIRTGSIISTCVDYTLFFEGPGQYFVSEAELAHERGIRLYTMSNTGGLTWDIGVIPYEPTPYQWMRRYDGLHKARQNWGLSGLMESHHFGWWPSFISELAKWSYWSPSPSSDEVLRMIAKRDFGEENVETVIEAWKAWSEGIRNYISTNPDQYGPFRIGPSYPLVFKEDVKIPTVPYAMFGGNRICATNYSYPNYEERLPVEIEILSKMKEYFKSGVESLEEIYETLHEDKKKEAFYMINLGKFIVNCVKTTINVKNWYILKMQLLDEVNKTDETNKTNEVSKIDKVKETDKVNEADVLTNTVKTKINEYIDSMIQLAKEEIKNAEDTIPLVEADSRLGWEPSMEYMTDVYHLKWKIEQVRHVIEKELPEYKASLN
jgi:hypothetical protein